MNISFKWFLTVLYSGCFLFPVFGQCGPDGTQPCSTVPTKSVPRKEVPKPKTNPSTSKSKPLTGASKSSEPSKSTEPKDVLTEEGLLIPKEMNNRGFAKELMVGKELQYRGYPVPLDFADLAELRLQNILVLLPVETENYKINQGDFYLMNEEVRTGLFTSFDYDNQDEPGVIEQGAPKYKTLEKLARNFDGEKFDLNTPSDREAMRINLIRMLRPQAVQVLEEIASEFKGKFGKKLEIRKMTASLQYQIELNSTNGNSYRVRPGTVPPHTTGCAFDITRVDLSIEEQNFLMQKFAKLVRAGKINSLIEGNIDPNFHIFVFPE